MAPQLYTQKQADQQQAGVVQQRTPHPTVLFTTVATTHRLSERELGEVLDRTYPMYHAEALERIRTGRVGRKGIDRAVSIRAECIDRRAHACAIGG